MKNYYFYLFIIISLFFFNNLQAYSTHNIVQDDTVQVPDVAVAPAVDGIGDDQCWQNISWQSIDEVWIPYGGSVLADDYSGRYKLVWSAATNLLYFLVEVNDDVFVDGFIPGVTADIYNFDITEVFIDEDASGGEHRYDGGGSNAENAFAYHIYADYPEEGSVTTDIYVGDMASTPPNYASHFPEFALRKTGNTAVWEFSLIVYKDTYTPTNIDNARVQLQSGKVMGLSIAYCDNDDPDGQRDNMFGSVWEPSPGNLHWQNADYFGKVKLVPEISTGVIDEHTAQTNSIKVYPNPSSTLTKLQLDNQYRGEISIQLFNILGQEIFLTTASKTDRIFTKTLLWNRLSSGIYFLQTQMGKFVSYEKLIIN